LKFFFTKKKKKENIFFSGRHERKLIQEAWKAALPEKDRNRADMDRRVTLEYELEKDKWNQRSHVSK